MNQFTNEHDLILGARRFDEPALAEIYDRYSPGVYRYAAFQLGDAHLAEDCVADTFLRFLQALRSGGGPHEHLQAYLYRIAHNWVTDRYRRPPPAAIPLDEELESEGDDPLQITLDGIEKAQVQAALMSLTPDQRRVIVMKYLEGYENEAVARRMEKPVGAVKALQHRALEALRRIILPPKEEVYESRE